MSALALAIAAACCFANARNTVSRPEPRAFLRIEAGRADIHRPSSTAPVIAVRLGRRIDPAGVVRVALGATASGADESYVTVEAGMEVRPLARGSFTPVAGVGLGFLAEPEFTGAVFNAMAALELEVARNIALRVGVQIGTHGGERGPNALVGAMEFR